MLRNLSSFENGFVFISKQKSARHNYVARLEFIKRTYQPLILFLNFENFDLVFIGKLLFEVSTSAVSKSGSI